MENEIEAPLDGWDLFSSMSYAFNDLKTAREELAVTEREYDKLEKQAQIMLAEHGAIKHMETIFVLDDDGSIRIIKAKDSISIKNVSSLDPGPALVSIPKVDGDDICF